MNATPTISRPRVFCADDNPLVTDALRGLIQRSKDFDWMGAADSADALCLELRRLGCPDIVLLDVDMPGMNPFEAVSAMPRVCPRARVLMYSGMVRRDLIEGALDAGAWGYVSKADGESALFQAMHAVLRDEVALSPEAAAIVAGT
jgi:DNA-binding NarL/FixJ family response regulator